MKFRIGRFIPFGILATVLTLTVLLVINNAEDRRYVASFRDEKTQASLYIRSTIEQELNSRLFIISGLYGLVRYNPELTMDEFLTYIDSIPQEVARVQSIQLAPGGTIAMLYPLEGNEEALGLDLYALDHVRPILDEIRSENRFMVQGPISLVQGGNGILGRTPVFLRNGDFWGYLAVLINFDDLMDFVGELAIQRDLLIGLRGFDGRGAEGDWFYGDEDMSDPVVSEVLFRGGSWILHAAPVSGWPRTRPSSRSFVILSAIAALFIGAAAAYVAAIRAGQSQRNAELLVLQQQLIKSERSAVLNETVAGISHEVTNPLGVAYTAQSVISDELRSLAAAIGGEGPYAAQIGKLRQSSELAQGNLERAKELLSSFRSVSAAQFADDLDEFNIVQTVEQCVELLKPEARKNRISLQFEASGEFIPVRSYSGAISIVVTNLVLNALRHGFISATPIENPRVTLSLRPEGEEIVLKVRDNGIGIAEQVRPSIFRPYFTTAKDRGGTGLGLSVVHSLVSENLSGDIDVASNPGEGSEFTVHFPRRISGAEQV